MNRPFVLAAVTALVLYGSGCSIQLDPKVPTDLGARREGSVATAAAATGMPARAGWGTVTMFAIPIAPVRVTNEDANQAVMNKVRETLTSVGYTVVDGAAAAGVPRLECTVQRFEFTNFTFWFPFVSTSGGVTLAMRLVDYEGRTLWENAYPGEALDTTYSFTNAANDATAQALSKFAHDALGESFHTACCRAPAR